MGCYGEKNDLLNKYIILKGYVKGKRKNKGTTKCNDGSITLETALVLPIMMMCMCALFSSIEMVTTYLRINTALYTVGHELSMYSYTYETAKDEFSRLITDVDDQGKETKSITFGTTEKSEDGTGEENDNSSDALMESLSGFAISETYVRARLMALLGNDYINSSMIKNKALGISLIRSDILEGNDDIDLVVTYTMNPWFFKNIINIRFVNRCRMHAWLGYSKENDTATQGEDSYVYVAENGEVYHLYRDCTHLSLSIYPVSSDTIGEYRNDGGEKYKACEYCCKSDKSEGNQYYITDWGDKYHTSLSCQGLKRTVYSIRLSEVGGKGLCSKCGKRK